MTGDCREAKIGEPTPESPFTVDIVRRNAAEKHMSPGRLDRKSRVKKKSTNRSRDPWFLSYTHGRSSSDRHRVDPTTNSLLI